VAAYLRASRAMWRELHSTPVARRAGERVVVEHSVAGLLADGTPHAVTVADVFTLRDGVVVHMQAYADPVDAPE
jgi:ketosteroid isomerase-like protein